MCFYFDDNHLPTLTVDHRLFMSFIYMAISWCLCPIRIRWNSSISISSSSSLSYFLDVVLCGIVKAYWTGITSVITPDTIGWTWVQPDQLNVALMQNGRTSIPVVISSSTLQSSFVSGCCCCCRSIVISPSRWANLTQSNSIFERSLLTA